MAAPTRPRPCSHRRFWYPDAMSALARNQTSDCANPVLDVYMQVNGILQDVAQLEFQIFDITDPDNPLQVYPATLGDRAPVDVSQLCPAGAKLDTGHYVATWTVPALEVTGTHQIRWFIKLTLSSGEQTFIEEFEVLPEVSAFGELGYCLVSEVRAEGVTTAQASDARLLLAISRASRFIERATGRWFDPRTCTFTLDGPGTPSLMIEIPIIGISQIKVNDNEVDLTELRIYNRHLTQRLTAPDDRNDPRIQWLGSDRRHVYPYGRRLQQASWGVGTQNVEVTGVFGYTDYNGSPTGGIPELIRYACILLVLREYPPQASAAAADQQTAYRLTSERTRDQSYTLAAPRAGGGTGLFTGDSRIDDILASFMAPPRLGST